MLILVVHVSCCLTFRMHAKTVLGTVRGTECVVEAIRIYGSAEPIRSRVCTSP